MQRLSTGSHEERYKSPFETERILMFNNLFANIHVYWLLSCALYTHNLASMTPRNWFVCKKIGQNVQFWTRLFNLINCTHIIVFAWNVYLTSSSSKYTHHHERETCNFKLCLTHYFYDAHKIVKVTSEIDKWWINYGWNYGCAGPPDLLFHDTSSDANPDRRVPDLDLKFMISYSLILWDLDTSQNYCPLIIGSEFLERLIRI